MGKSEETDKKMSKWINELTNKWVNESIDQSRNEKKKKKWRME